MTDTRTVVLALAMALTPLAASAQSNAGPPSNVRMRIGPLFVNPTLALSNAGRDTNVFNDAKNPKEDVTITITPATDLWLRVGPSWVQGNIREDIVWFQKFTSERSANNSYTVKWMIPLNRLTVTPNGAYVNTRERPGYEIDARAERTEKMYGGNIEYRLFTKTFVGVEARRAMTDFVEGSFFQGTDLHNELNRTVDIGTLNVRHQMTPLTSLNLSASIDQDRFQFDPLRNSDSRGYAASIRFDPAALIKGTASFGYRDFKPKSPDLPGYQGSTFAVDLSYVLLGVTRFTVNAVRDVQYSYDVNEPYYLQTGIAGSIGQQIFGPVDVVVRGGVRRLEYRDRITAIVPIANRTDRPTSYGAGIGYHLGRDTRVGVNADHTRRDSAVDARQYQGWTYGIAVTYASGIGGS
jgi:hypothetical protein